jgi:DNA-binding transcriptional ArsR family regulator
MYRLSTIQETSNMLDRNTVAPTPAIEADQIAVIAKAMAHPARVRIIAFLLSKPGCIGGDIVDQVGLAQSTVSEHLRILKDAGIVQGAIDYPRVCYSLEPSALAPIRALIEAIAARPPQGEEPCCFTPQGCVSKETDQ